MERTGYLIGEVAELMGVSRDTLRYYEKCGILKVNKDTSGYRYYTEQDINSLVSILYQRKMNFGLSEMQMLWGEQGTLEEMADVIDERLAQERQAIRDRERTVARLVMTKNDCENIRKNLGKVVLKYIPASYVIEEHTGLHESVELWFDYARKYPGMDMMYMLDEYVWDQENEKHAGMQYKNTQMIIYQDVAEYVDYRMDEDHMLGLSSTLCVSAFLASPTRTPEAQSILPVLQWAKEQGIALSDRMYISYALQGVRDGERMYYLYVYIPLVM